jgi:NAD+ synthase (glutamine-hydrolysing)
MTVQKIMLNRDLGFLRIAAAVPDLRVADVDFNVDAMLGMVKEARSKGVQVLAFPEMSVTGYTIADLVHQQSLLTKAEDGLMRLAAGSAGSGMLIVAGLPLCVDQKVFNCAAVLNGGQVLAVIPKTYLPAYKEYYENRWFPLRKRAPIRYTWGTGPFPSAPTC